MRNRIVYDQSDNEKDVCFLCVKETINHATEEEAQRAAVLALAKWVSVLPIALWHHVSGIHA